MDGTTVVVTGASRGLGAAAAREFGAAGAHVAVCARSMDDLEAVAEDVEAAGGRATTVRADVRDECDVERFLEVAAGEGAGTVDVVVANAGVYHGATGETPLTTESYAAFDEHLRTNARGVFATIQEAVPHLADDARVLVPSGAIAREARPGYGSYAVSKATAEALARGFAVELDVAVGIVDPGQVTTELTTPDDDDDDDDEGGSDGRRGRDPVDVAGLFRWAATDAPAAELDGEVLGLREWRTATR
jgi:NAD(P)-dependent dehydrogenase (short-subunit alcohol dehydrogenase family)